LSTETTLPFYANICNKERENIMKNKNKHKLEKMQIKSRQRERER
jgi:hypothetical protein